MSTALFVSGIVCTAIAVGVILIVWLGPWPAGTEHQRLDIFGRALLCSFGGMFAVIVSLAIGGPVGRFKGKADRSGLEWEAEAPDPPAPPAQPQVTTTTTVTPAPPPAPGT
jgi:hypothetical protein